MKTKKEPYSRTRIFKDTQSTYTGTYSASNGTIQPPKFYVGESEFDSMQDVVTPGYLSLVAHGAIINSPCHRVKNSFKVIPGSWGQSWPAKTNPVVPSGSNLWSGIDTIADVETYGTLVSSNRKIIDVQAVVGENNRIASLKALANIDAASHALGEDFFEGGKAYQTLRHPINSLLPIHEKLKRALRHHDEVLVHWRRSQSRGGAFSTNRKVFFLKERLRSIDAVSALWLQARLGYAQLAYSAMHLDDYFRFERNSNQAQKDRVNGRVRSVGMSERSYDLSHERTYLTGAGTVIIEYTASYYVKAKSTIIYERSSLDPSMGLTKDLGLRLKDMPRTAWNLVPASWFVDRFVDISSALQGFMNLHDPRIHIKTGCVTHTTRYNETAIIKSAVHKTSGWGLTASGSKERVGETINRSPWYASDKDLKPPLTSRSLSDVKQFTDEAAFVIRKVSKLL